MTKQDSAVPVQALEEDGRLPETSPGKAWQTGVGVVVALVALVLAWGTWLLPAQEQLIDGGARLLPGLCAGVLFLCGLWLVWEARHGGWRNSETLLGLVGVQIMPWVWVSAGLLLSALLVRFSGFIVAAALCYVFALQGLRLAAQPHCQVCGKRLLSDIAIGLLIAAAVYGVFTRILGIALPSGWSIWK
ncbi:tripartite tricarboxylate transporter TctB family protein [Comamonas sp. NoAH]|uniref:tripartite tricarboxylate transporter TctB family protein n=1 Tax=Comamonas halotolerans TaxID=3041496 RepID=UPI0024E0A1BB|nr:tripartite tricarboxylate transporter TctB family protein [Comamonas sp. NoAH]